MKRFAIRSVAVAVACTLSTTCCGQAALPAAAKLNVTARPQQMTNWCWAASGQMIMEFLGTSVDQCTQANNRFGAANCCGLPASCDNGGWPEFDKYGFTFQTTSFAPLTWSQLQSEIGSGNRPVAFTWLWNSGGGHMMVAHGYFTLDGRNFVSIIDPLPKNIGDQRDIPYDEYVQGAKHTHWDDYYAVAKSAKANTGASGAKRPEAEPKPVPKDQGVDLSAAITQSRDAAAQSLGTYRKLAAQQDGPGAEQAADAKLGQPFPVVWIGLSELREPPGGNPIQALSEKADQVIYPIQSSESEIRSSVTLQKTDGDWKDVAYGNVALTRLMTQTRAKYAEATKQPIQDFYAVSIPALNTYLVATGRAGGATLIPIVDDQTLGLKAGVPMPAERLMPILVAAARKHNGLPR